MISESGKVTYTGAGKNRKAFRKLCLGTDIKVPYAKYIEAWNTERLGDALSILVPTIFSQDDLLVQSVKGLELQKVLALIGVFSFSFKKKNKQKNKQKQKKKQAFAKRRGLSH